MPIPNPFQLERFFARYEFRAPYLLSPSDCESLSLQEVLAMADPQCRALWESLSLGYTESPGHPLLREQIAGMYASVRPEQVLVAAPEELIFLTMQALLAPGDEVVVLQPAYQSLHEVARAAGCRVLPWRLVPEAAGWRLDLDALRSLLVGRPRLLVINFPHNPTGYLPSRAELETILNMADSAGCLVFMDEMYRGLEYRPEDQLPAACDLYENSLSLSGMSKAYALPGLRIGWVASRRADLIERLQAYKDYTTICSSAPSEILALIGLRAGEAIRTRNLEIIRENLAAAAEFFGGQPERYEWLAPRAGSVAFPRWVGPGSVEDFCQRLAEERGAVLAPGSLFDFPGHFRVGLGRKNFREGVKKIKDEG